MGIGEFFLPLLPHPVKVYVFEKRDDGYLFSMDKARFVNERMGKRYYHYKKRNITKPIPYSALNRKNEALVFSPDREVMVPMKLNFTKMVPVKEKEDQDGKKIEVLKRVDLEVDILEEDIRFWTSQQFHEADRKYEGGKGFWEKYGMIIAPAIILIGSGIFFYILNHALGDSIGALTSAVKSLRGSVDSIQGVGW